ncbi:hypothetical protein R6Q57_026374 [Mikania cordata]
MRVNNEIHPFDKPTLTTSVKSRVHDSTMAAPYLIRRVLDSQEVYSPYAGFPNLFSIKLHHGGEFTRFPDRSYNGGKVVFANMLNIEKFSVHELDQLMSTIGYSDEDVRYYHYLAPGSDLDYGIRALGSDSDVIGFSEIEEVTYDQLRMQNEAKKSCSRLLLDWDWEQSVNKIGQSDNVKKIGQGGSSFREIGQSANVNEIGQSDNVKDIGQRGSVREIGQSGSINEVDSIFDNIDFDPFFGEDSFVHNEGLYEDVDDGKLDDNRVTQDNDFNEDDENCSEDGNKGTNNDSDGSDFKEDDGNCVDDVEVDMRDFRMHTDECAETSNINSEKLDDEDDTEVIDTDLFDN